MAPTTAPTRTPRGGDLVTHACPPRRAGRPRDERASRAIAEAALRLLGDVGYANMSMESVAAEARVSRATIYRRYQDKADLITSAIAIAAQPPTTSGDPLGDLVSFLEEFDSRIAEICLEVVGCLLGSRADPSAMARHRDRVIGPRMGAVVGLVVRAKEAGLFGERADPDLLAEMLMGAIFARRIIGLPAEKGWALRAVGTACTGAATAEGIAHLRGVTGSRRAASRSSGSRR